MAATDKQPEDIQLEAVPTASFEAPVRAGGLQDRTLERSFSVWSLGGLCLCLMATWEALSSTVAQALVSGGAPCLFWN